MRKIFPLLLLCLLATFAGAAFADDDPCAGETGPGKGLCTAYCEATDCDCSYDDDCVVPKASDVGCFNIYFSYGFTTGNPLTCGDVCPCLDANGWPSPGSANIWIDLATGTGDIGPANECEDDGIEITLGFQPEVGALLEAEVTDDKCKARLFGPVIFEDFEFTLTPAEATLCRALLVAQAAAQDLDCDG